MTITHEAASAMAEEAIKKAMEMNLAISICILDNAGNLIHFLRMDNAPLISIETSKKKASMAVGFGMPTGDAWYDFIKNDPLLMNGAQQLPGFILLGGGLPINIDGHLCGAIGISGGHYKQDEICAKQALSIFS